VRDERSRQHQDCREHSSVDDPHQISPLMIEQMAL
jgi:hypothetical protein